MATAHSAAHEQGSEDSGRSVSDQPTVSADRHATFDGFDPTEWPDILMMTEEDDPDSDDDVDDDKLPDTKPLDHKFMGNLLAFAIEGQFKQAIEFVGGVPDRQLQLQRDKHQRTAAHYAGMSPEGAELLKKLVQRLGTSCLRHEDCNSVAPLHYAAQNYSLQQFSDLFLGAEQELRSSNYRNKVGDTLAHFAARNTSDEKFIKSVLHGNKSDRLLWQNNRGSTVLHEAVEHCSAETVKYLLSQGINHFIPLSLRDESNDHQQDEEDETSASANKRARKWKARQEAIEKMKNLKDSDGNTLAHCASRNRNPSCYKGAVFLEVQQLFGQECLNWRNSMDQTVLQAVIEYSPDSTAEQMVEEFAKYQYNIDQLFTHADEYKNSYLHFAAMYKKVQTFGKILELMLKARENECIKQIKDKSNVDGKTVFFLAASSKDELFQILKEKLPHFDLGRVLGERDSRSRNMLFYACMSWNFFFFNVELEKPDAFTEADTDGNSLLHALFLNHETDQKYSSDNFFQAVNFLAEKMTGSIRRENNMGKNFLHCSQVKEKFLIEILNDARKYNWEEKLKEVFLSKDGVHVVHEFACRYNLRALMTPLSKIAGVKKAELRSKKVERGPFKGATCLHFACRAGHPANIFYLQNKSLSIYARDGDGHTCVDYARNTDQLQRLVEVVETKLKNREGQEPLIEFLRLLDPAQAALKLPDRVAAMQHISEIVDQPVIDDVERGQSQFKKEAQKDQANPSTDVASKSSIEVSVFEAVWKDGSTRALRSALKLDPVSSDTQAKFIRYWVKKHPGDKCIEKNEEEMRIVDLALRRDKLDLLPDLILTRQFELIPSCILLIIQLKQKKAKTDESHDQLKRLKSKVISIAVNTLDELYLNANGKERQLLFNYIRGDVGGPKFSIAEDESSRALTCCGDESQQTQRHTILELVEIAECEDLYATDCIYKLAEEEWKNSKICGSPKIHFRLSLAIYVVFMFYFAWFITDFKRTFDWLGSDIALTAFALLFVVLELFELFSLPLRKICCCSSRMSKCSMHWRNVYNMFDFIALLLLWLGIVWKWVIFGKPDDDTAYACQSVLSTSFLFFGFRSVAFLSLYKRIGHVIVILMNLIVKDLLPFLAIIAIVFLSFGVFFFNLLFPSITTNSTETQKPFYWWRVMLQIFTMPFDLLFTNYDRFEFDTPRIDLPQEVGFVTNAIGLSWFRNLTMFVFLLLVNIVMVNLLIALFSLRVSTLHSKATGIWRQGYFELIRAYQRRAELCRCCFGRSASIDPDDKRDVKEYMGKKYHNSYLLYLRYQAQQLRKLRPRLSKELEKHRTDFEKLKAHFENNITQASSEISDDLARLQRKLNDFEHSQNLRILELEHSQQRRQVTGVRRANQQQRQLVTGVRRADQQQSQQGTAGVRRADQQQSQQRTAGVSSAHQQQSQQRTAGVSSADQQQSQQRTAGVRRADQQQSQQRTAGVSSADQQQSKQGTARVRRADQQQSQQRTAGVSSAHQQQRHLVPRVSSAHQQQRRQQGPEARRTGKRACRS